VRIGGSGHPRSREEESEEREGGKKGREVVATGGVAVACRAVLCPRSAGYRAAMGGLMKRCEGR